MNKRDRCVNWEREEKQLLREIIYPYKHTLENKNLNTDTNKAKANAWNKITEQFNRANKRPRDKKQIINQWKLVKLKSKREISQYRQQILQTGGGRILPSPGLEALEVLEMIPQGIGVDFNEYDCDGATSNTGNEATNCNNVNMVFLVDDVDEGPQLNLLQSSSQMKSQTIYSVKEPLTPRFSAKKRTLSKNKTFDFDEASYEDMHKFRVLEANRQQKEHEFRMKTMAEIHAQEMVNLKLQEEILRKQLNKT